MNLAGAHSARKRLSSKMLHERTGSKILDPYRQTVTHHVTLLPSVCSTGRFAHLACTPTGQSRGSPEEEMIVSCRKGRRVWRRRK